MGSKYYTIETVEQLFDTATKRRDYTERWKLDDHWVHVFVDAKAGEEWEASYNAHQAAKPNQREVGELGMQAWRDLGTEIYNRKPAQKQVRCWHLIHSTGSWNNTYLELGEKLGEQVLAVWTKSKATDWRKDKPTGTMTLGGLLKRLGKTGLSDALAAKVDLEKRRTRAFEINNHRERIVKAATNLLEELERCGDNANIIVIRSLLTDCLNQTVTNASERVEVPEK